MEGERVWPDVFETSETNRSVLLYCIAGLNTLFECCTTKMIN
jgi:hypothetical protein